MPSGKLDLHLMLSPQHAYDLLRLQFHIMKLSMLGLVKLVESAARTGLLPWFQGFEPLHDGDELLVLRVSRGHDFDKIQDELHTVLRNGGFSVSPPPPRASG